MEKINKQSRDCPAPPKKLSCLLLCSLSLSFFGPHAFYLHAQTLSVDSGAPSSKQASVSPAPNGVPVVDIARPNSEGVSHNLFKEFHVGKKGLVMNNSDSIKRSQLAGILMANPNIERDQEAVLILNEVTGPHPSQLRGYTEIHGKAAEYILANPYGISCKGCGFINTPRASLSTGAVLWDEPKKKVLGFAVERGDVSFEAEALNATSVDTFDVISARVFVQGKVHAQDLSFFVGRGDFDYVGRRIRTQGAQEAAAQGTAWAIDAGALGSIHARRIYLESTAQGAGVRLAGNMMTHTDSIIVKTRSKLVLASKLSAKGRLHLEAERIMQLEGSLASQSNLHMQSTGLLQTKGVVYAQGDMDLSAGNVEIKTGSQVFAGTKIELQARKLDLEGMLYSGLREDGTRQQGGQSRLLVQEDIRIAADAQLSATAALQVKARALEIEGKIMAGMDGAGSLDLDLSAKLHLKRASHIYSGGDMRIKSSMLQVDSDAVLAAGMNEQAQIGDSGSLEAQVQGSILNQGVIGAAEALHLESLTKISNEAMLFSRSKMDLYFRELHNMEGARILARTDISMQKNSAGHKADKLLNQSASIESWEGSITLRAGTIENEKKDFEMSTTAVPFSLHHPTFECREANCYGNPTRGNVEALSLRSRISQGLATAEPGLIAAKQDISIFASLIENTYSIIRAGRNITIQSDALLNKAGAEYDIYTVRSWEVYFDSRGFIRREHTGCTVNVFGVKICSGSDAFYGPYWSAAEPWDEKRAAAGGQSFPALIQAGGSMNIVVTEHAKNLDEGGARRFTSPAQPSFSQPSLSLDSITLPEGRSGLFIRNTGAGHSYLIETNPLFVDMQNYLGSEYFFQKIGISKGESEYEQQPDEPYEAPEKTPEKTLAKATDPKLEHVQLLGDPYYETRLVQKQIFEQTGSYFLEEGVTSHYEQMQSLFDNAVQAYKDLELSPGVALSAEQAQQLKQDIIWMEERIVQGHKVLVPRLYLAKAGTKRAQSTVARIDAKDVYLKAGTLANTGAGAGIMSYGKLHIDTDINLENLGGVLSGDEVLLKSKGDIVNQSGWIHGTKVEVSARRDLIHESLVGEVRIDAKNYSQYLVGSAGIHASSLHIQTGRNLQMKGALLESQGKAVLAVGGDLTISAAQLDGGYDIRFGNGDYEKSQSRRYTASLLKTGSALHIEGKGAFLLEGSRIESQKEGFLNFQGPVSIAGLYGQDVYESKSSTKERERNFMDGKEVKTTVTRGYDMQKVFSSSLNFGKDLKLLSADAMRIAGSQIEGDGNITIAAKHLVISSAENQEESWSSTIKQEKKYKTSIKGSHTHLAEEEQEERVHKKEAQASLIRAGGDILIKSHGDIDIYGSQLLGQLDTRLDAGTSIRVQAAVTSQQEKRDMGRTELGLGMDSQTNVEISYSVQGEEESAHSQSVLGSFLGAKQGTLSLSAKEEIRVEASELHSLEGDIYVDADAGIQLLAVQAEQTSKSSSSFVRAAIGTNVAQWVGGVVNLYGSIEESRSEHTMRSNTHLQSTLSAKEGTIHISSGEDLLQKGSSVLAKDIDIKVAGDLRLETLQNESTTSGNQSRRSLSVSYGSEGGLNAAASFSSSQFSSQRKWADDLSSILGTSSVLLNVGGDAYVQGALIANQRQDGSDGGELQVLVQGSLIAEDLRDQDISRSKQHGLGLGTQLKDLSFSLGKASGTKIGITRATIGMGELRVGKGTAPAINRDIHKVQEILKDESKSSSLALDLAPVMQAYTSYTNLGEGIKALRDKLEDGEFENIRQLGRDAAGILKNSASIALSLGDLAAKTGLGSVAALSRSIAKDLSKGYGALDALDWKKNLRAKAEEKLGFLAHTEAAQSALDGAEQYAEVLEKKALEETVILAEKSWNLARYHHFELDEKLVKQLHAKRDGGADLDEYETEFLKKEWRNVMYETRIEDYQQNRKNKKMIQDIEAVYNDIDSLSFDKGLVRKRSALIKQLSLAQGRREKRRIGREIEQINAKERVFNRVKKYISRRRNKARLAASAASELCNVITYNRIGVILGKDKRSLKQFFQEELQKGNIGWNPQSKKVSLAYGLGSAEWRKNLQMARYRKEQYKKYREKDDLKVLPPKGVGFTSRDVLNENNAHVAISFQDTNKSGSPNHFMLIARGEDGVWYNMDHTTHGDNRWLYPVAWANVHGVDYKKNN